MKSIKNNTLQNIPCNEDSGSQIPWHPAFVEALQLELEAYKDVLEFHPELQLTTEPLRIDCVVIKKLKEVKIEKNIGAIFRTWNILEYKSPEDYVSVSDFYKVYGYACIYITLNEIPITDLTITFVESRYPRELIKHLKNVRGYTVAKTSAGVYTVSGDILSMQIIDSRKLSADDNVWLKNLRKNLKRSDVELINIRIAQKGKFAKTNAYAYAIACANINKMEEKLMTLKEIETRYEQLIEKTGLGAKWEAREREKWTGVVADKDAVIADKDAVIADKDAVISKLMAELEKR
ncbi:MAG: hypothetical protein FWD26_09695 [Treponema sp.]|nr:hypothetical protein [Treponema sp.]